MIFLSSLVKELEMYDFMVCAHFHYNPIRVDIFDGTAEGSQSLTVVNFEVVRKTDNLNPDVLDLGETWFGELE